jgi:two-component system, NtrC family, response regulator AtoC
MPRRARILTVDDEPEILSALTEFLTLQDYDAVAAQTAHETFTAVAVAPPDVVLLDINMPIVDGVRILRHLRMMYPQLPVVMVTGNADIEVAGDTLKLGAFDYVTEPFDFLYLARVIEAAVAHRG